MTIPSGRSRSIHTGTTVRDGAGRLVRRARLAVERARERTRRELRRLIAANTAGALHRALGDRADDEQHRSPVLPPLGRRGAGAPRPTGGADPVGGRPLPAVPGTDPLAA